MLPPPAAPPGLTGQAQAAWGAVALRWPGVALCAVIALAASFVAGLHQGPQFLYALFFGVCLHYLSEEDRTCPGIDFCARTVLRIGVALLGARITVAQIAALGWTTAGIVVAAVLLTIAFGVALSRRLGMGSTRGFLSGGATAICGASAALAIAAVLPKSREQERFTLVVVMSVTTLSTIAMLLYPPLARALGLSPSDAGLFLGATIHDVAQVVGAGYMMGSETGDQAVIVKLLRVSLLAVVVTAASVACLGMRTAAGADRPPLLPGFLWGFLALVAVNSFGWLPGTAHDALNHASRACLALAIAALGLKTSFGALAQTGWRAFALLLAETAWLAAIVLVAIQFTRLWP